MNEIAVIIPAYNEELRLLPTLIDVHAFLTKTVSSFEIIVVNDGSSDNTANLVKEFVQTHINVSLIDNQKNSGKGFAIRQGVLKAESDLILIDDADGSSPITELPKLLASLKKGNDIAIGSRAKPDTSRYVEALTYRKVIGRIYSLIINSLLLPGFYDTQCGFKLYKQEVAKQIFSFSTINGYSFDIETLFLAKQLKYQIDEIAINWHNVEGSKVNIITDSLKMLFETIKIKLKYQCGSYKLKGIIK